MSTVARRPELITRRGYEQLRAELDHLVTVMRRRVADDLRDAREDGAEPGENLAVASALGDQVALERRIDELEVALALVEVVDPPADGVAGIGQRVLVRMDAGTAPVAYELVGALETDPPRGRISVDSPVGEALVGRRAGEVVEVETPRGPRLVEIVAVGVEA